MLGSEVILVAKGMEVCTVVAVVAARLQADVVTVTVVVVNAMWLQLACDTNDTGWSEWLTAVDEVTKAAEGRVAEIGGALTTLTWPPITALTPNPPPGPTVANLATD